MKLKLSRKQLAVLGVVVLLLLGVLVARHKGPSGGPGRMDAAADRACSDFASGYPHAKTKAARLALADKVTQSSSKSDNKTIRDRAAEMGHNAGETTASWKSSGAALTNACQSAGWKS